MTTTTNTPTVDLIGQLITAGQPIDAIGKRLDTVPLQSLAPMLRATSADNVQAVAMYLTGDRLALAMEILTQAMQPAPQATNAADPLAVLDQAGTIAQQPAGAAPVLTPGPVPGTVTMPPVLPQQPQQPMPDAAGVLEIDGRRATDAEAQAWPVGTIVVQLRVVGKPKANGARSRYDLIGIVLEETDAYGNTKRKLRSWTPNTLADQYDPQPLPLDTDQAKRMAAAWISSLDPERTPTQARYTSDAARLRRSLGI